MLNLSKITLLLLASIGLTACGAVNKLKNTIEGLDGECSFCEFDEDEQLIRPNAVPVDADIFTVANGIRGVIGTSSGIILEDIEDSDDEPTYDEMTLDNTEGGFAYFTDSTGGFEYVGILEDTDLGDALYFVPSTGVTTATWDATIVVIAAGTPQTRTFPLEVNFNSRQITGRNIQFAPVSSGVGIPATSRIGTLEGTFLIAGQTNAGQLTGTFDIAGDTIDEVKMYGLIGEDGAVGVFSGTYFGGFVAEPQ